MYGQCSADVDKPDSSGNTALHLAVSGGKLGIAALLVAAGADADAENCGFDGQDSDWCSSSNEDGDDDGDEVETDSPESNKRDELSSQEKSGRTPRQLAVGDVKVK